MIPVLLLAAAACQAPDYTTTDLAEKQREVQATIDAFTDRDPSMRDLFETSYGYAVFPSVGGGGAVVGGGHGNGLVYERGVLVGSTALTKFTMGAQLGGQTQAQVMFFKTRDALRDFQDGSFEFDASASAIAIKSGAAQAADFSDGVEVFVMPKQGLMAAATIGGQKFAYEPIAAAMPQQ